MTQNYIIWITLHYIIYRTRCLLLLS